jgi:hypothetical protein
MLTVSDDRDCSFGLEHPEKGRIGGDTDHEVIHSNTPGLAGAHTNPPSSTER